MELGPKIHLAHELVNQFVVDHPDLATQVRQDPPVAVAMFVSLETLPDRLLECRVCVRFAESFWR